jgi:AcrR family transcriptional regulator
MPSIIIDDNKDQSAEGRIRRTPDHAREIALDAARRLLLAGGPPAVTLKAVADAIGMTHGNVRHHFGGSAGLQAQLVSRLAGELAVQAQEAVLRLRRGEVEAENVVDLVFSAFVETGCGRLIGWLSATGNQQALEPVFEVIRRAVEAMRAGEPEGVERLEAGAGPITLALISLALTASLVGEQLEAATGLPAGSLRRLATRQLGTLRATEATAAMRGSATAPAAPASSS